MTDTIKTVEVQVGGGKTYSIIQQIHEMTGIILYACPTKKLVIGVYNSIEERETTLTTEGLNPKEVLMVTDDNLDGFKRVTDRLKDIILDEANSELIIVCTHAGIELISSEINESVERLGREITVIIDELPNLFNASYHYAPSERVKHLSDVMDFDNDIPKIINRGGYEDLIRADFLDKNLVKQLKLILNNTVRTEPPPPRSGGMLFHGYELKENLNRIMRVAKDVYLLAGTIEGTLDHIILQDIWNYTLEPCEKTLGMIDHDNLKQRGLNIKVTPLLDSDYSWSKGSGKSSGDLTVDSITCIKPMLDKALEIIGDNQAIVSINTWANAMVTEYLKEHSNIKILPPNVKGLNDYQGIQYACAIYSAKPKRETRLSLELLAEKYNLPSLIDAHSLQIELDSVVQIFGRTSIRDKDSTKTCHFIVSDQRQARHVVKTLTGSLAHYKNIVDESYMVNWQSFSGIKMGRPLEQAKQDRLAEMTKYIDDSLSQGTKPSTKELMLKYGISEGQVSKDKKEIARRKLSNNPLEKVA